MDKQKLMKLAVKWYPEKKLAHAVRVATYAADQPFIDEETADSLWAIGLMHDILEDTPLTYQQLNETKLLNSLELEAIQILTHHKEDCPYDEYIRSIAEEGNLFAIVVKRCDMKDHLMLKDTLTEKLQNKYFPVIKYLL